MSAWSECPTCNSFGRVWINRSRYIAGPVTGEDVNRDFHLAQGDVSGPCPTCAAHEEALAELKGQLATADAALVSLRDECLAFHKMLRFARTKISDEWAGCSAESEGKQWVADIDALFKRYP